MSLTFLLTTNNFLPSGLIFQNCHHNKLLNLPHCTSIAHCFWHKNRSPRHSHQYINIPRWREKNRQNSKTSLDQPYGPSLQKCKVNRNVIVGSYLDLPWPPRAEEGLRVDSDTLRYLKKIEPLCPSRKCGPNLGEAKIQNGRRRPSWIY